MAVKLIISDIDGCISPEESRAWDWPAFSRFAALSHAASEGRGDLAPMTLCTGRPQPYVEALMKVLDIRFPAICESGAVLYSLSDNRSRFTPAITPEKIRGLHALRDHITTEIMPAFPGLVYQFGKEAQMSLYCEQPACFTEVAELVRAHAATLPGLEVIIIPVICFMDSSTRTPGMMGSPGKCPWKKGSLIVTFFNPTTRSSPTSRTRSTSRNG